jgi:small subunit ribosomal protein S1
MGQVVPGEVTKLVPFGAFVRVAEGIEGLVHISELSGRHVEIPEQVVQVGDSTFVKVIDIDLERRRISLSLRQANEDADLATDESFDASLYGFNQYDENGNYIYPEGFDSETNDWKPGYEAQKAEWEAKYAEAHAKWEAHKAVRAESKKSEGEDEAQTSYSTDASAEGTLADDAALQALKDSLDNN